MSREEDIAAGCAQQMLAASQTYTPRDNVSQAHNVPEHHLVVDGNKAIVVFAWADAPASLRAYVPKGQTGGLFALVPADYQHDLSWITQSVYFGSESIDVYTLPTGQTVYVGT